MTIAQAAFKDNLAGSWATAYEEFATRPPPPPPGASRPFRGLLQQEGGDSPDPSANRTCSSTVGVESDGAQAGGGGAISITVPQGDVRVQRVSGREPWVPWVVVVLGMGGTLQHLHPWAKHLRLPWKLGELCHAVLQACPPLWPDLDFGSAGVTGGQPGGGRGDG